MLLKLMVRPFEEFEFVVDDEEEEDDVEVMTEDDPVVEVDD